MNSTKPLTPDQLKKLSLIQLKQIRGSLQKFFYANGTNVAFHENLQQKESQRFKKKVKRAIYKQVFHVAEVDKISKITETVSKISTKDLALLVAVYWLSFEDVLDDGTSTIFSFFVWAGNKGGQTALEKIIPPSKTFDLKNKEVIKKLENRVKFLTEVLDKTGINWTANIIEEGIKNGLTNTEIVKFLRREANKISLERADVITETELITAMNIVELETFKRNGIEKHKWIVTLDEKTCPICLGNEVAGYITVGNLFPSGTEIVPAHVRCRCYLLPQLPIKIDTKIWTGE